MKKTDLKWWQKLDAIKYDAHVHFLCKDCGYEYAFYIGVNDPKGSEINCCVGCSSENVVIKSIKRIAPSLMRELINDFKEKSDYGNVEFPDGVLAIIKQENKNDFFVISSKSVL